MVNCASPLVPIVHDALAVYPRWAASSFAAFGGTGANVATLTTRLKCNHIIGPPDLCSSPALNPHRPVLAGDSRQPLSFCCAQPYPEAYRQCALRVWRGLEERGRFGCPKAILPALERSRRKAPLGDYAYTQTLSGLQYELLLSFGVFALDLGHYWGSSGLPVGSGGERPSNGPVPAVTHRGVDQLRRSRAWWERSPQVVNASALDKGQWVTHCANFD